MGGSFIPDTLVLGAYQPNATARKVVQLLPGFDTRDANGNSCVFETAIVGGTNGVSGDSIVLTTRSDYELGADGNLLVLHTVDNFGRDEREYHHEFGFIDKLGNRTLFVRDMLGSNRATLRNGVVTDWRDYYAYGAVRDGKSLVSGRWQYLGLEYDSETGSLHTHARKCFNLEGFFNKPDGLRSSIHRRHPTVTPNKIRSGIQTQAATQRLSEKTNRFRIQLQNVACQSSRCVSYGYTDCCT